MALNIKIPKKLLSLLNNKYILYLTLLLAVATIIGYLFIGNINAVVLFVVVGYLTKVYTSNMTLILLTPLFITSLFITGVKVKEGLETMKLPICKKNQLDPSGNPLTDENNVPLCRLNPKKKSDKKEKDKDEDDKDEEEKEGEDEDEDEDKDEEDLEGNEEGEEEYPLCTDAQIENSQTANCRFSSKNSGKAKNSGKVTNSNNRIDHAQTVVESYEDLNKLIGSSGIKNLTTDTQKLLGQQLELTSAMKSMSPLLEQAKSLLSGFDLKGLGGMSEMVKSLENQLPTNKT